MNLPYRHSRPTLGVHGQMKYMPSIEPTLRRRGNASTIGSTCGRVYGFTMLRGQALRLSFWGPKLYKYYCILNWAAMMVSRCFLNC